MRIWGGFEGHLFYCRLKFRRQSRRNIHIRRAKLAESAWSQKWRFLKIMKSETNKKSVNNANTAVSNNVAEGKIKFPLYVFPDTMEKVDMLYEIDNCRSKTEFMEKAIRFYCGYLLNQELPLRSLLLRSLRLLQRVL